MAEEQSIVVRSHVARDLMQTAALFKTDRAVVTEYVANAVEYVDDGVAPMVVVNLDSRGHKITITDNGRGMDHAGLQNFFLMHGENLDRKRGRGRRGLFGTGKSAAFGIASVLRITTVRNKRRWQVELSRDAVRRMSSDAPIPVHAIERGVATDAPNGTVVEIENVQLKSLDQAAIIRHLERNLSGWTSGAQIFVNGHLCEFTEPTFVDSVRFRSNEQEYPHLGESDLVVKVSSVPLETDELGVAVTSGGVLYERTLGGNEGRPMSDFLFGQIEVPKLQSDDSPIAAFDQSRSLRLNPENALVRDILEFIGRSVDEVRRELVRKDKARQATEEAQAWESRAREIEDIINADFQDLNTRISRARSRIAGTAASSGGGSDGEDSVLFEGGAVPATEIANSGALGVTDGEGQSDRGEPRQLAPQLEESPDGPIGASPRPVSAREGARRGGFAVEFKPMGPDERRASYSRDKRTIYVNLDHRQIVMARGGAAASHQTVRRLAYEIAFTEYAIALASEFASQDEYLEVTDPIVAIRDSINRLASKAAHLFAPVAAGEL